jgi:hypothetical protein
MLHSTRIRQFKVEVYDHTFSSALHPRWAALLARERLSCGELSPERGQNEGFENGRPGGLTLLLLRDRRLPVH